MNPIKTLATLSLSLALALQAGTMVGAALVLSPSDVEAGQSWSPKIKPGLKPSPGHNRRPLPPFQPCHPNPRMCRGGGT